MNGLIRMSRPVLMVFAVLITSGAVNSAFADPDGDRSTHRQQRMLEEIAADYRATGHLTGRHRMSPALEAALSAVPRHAFVPETQVQYAYINRPLSIGHGQTISQPFIVALMTDLLDVDSGSRVLEIGTGSGYQAAVLAELAGTVYTIEIISALAESAAQRLAELGYANVHVRTGDGNHGWPEHAPFDRIIVTAGGRLPPALIEQLRPGGKLIIPIEHAAGDQVLTLIEKAADGSLSEREVLPVRFVPITGDN